MTTFKDISSIAKCKYCFDYISNVYNGLNDIHHTRIMGGSSNKIDGFKYSIIEWNHYYNPEINDYDIVFEGSYRFFSITNNIGEKDLKDITLKRGGNYCMLQLTEDCKNDIH